MCIRDSSLDIGQSDKQLSGNIKSLLTRFKVQRAKLMKHNQESQTKLQAIQSLDTIIGQLDKASKNPSLSDSAGFRSVAVHIPGSDAKDFQEQLSSVMAQSYISAINQAKAAGGGSLRITQQEIQTLAKAWDLWI